MRRVAIRPIERADEREWRRLWADYLAFYGTQVEEQIYRTAFERLLGDARYDPHGLIAERDGRPVGLVHYLFHRHVWRVEDVAYLQDLYVDPAARGQGAGRALIEAVYAAADSARCPSVYWLTQDFNHAARKLYDAVGELTPFIKYQRGR